MTAPATTEEMRTAAARLTRLHHIPPDTITTDADHLTVTVACIEDAERLRAEIPGLHPYATYTDRWTGWTGEHQITILLLVPTGIIPVRSVA